ncbi:MAG: hypothetical protein ABIJ45_04675 [Candidatus Zixiibacteriota bacterium]
MNKEKRKDWMMGFLGVFSLFGLRFFQTGEWLYLIWFTWVLWFTWFIPVKSQTKN